MQARTKRSELTKLLGKDPGIYIEQQRVLGRRVRDVAAELGVSYYVACDWRLDATGKPIVGHRHGIAPGGLSVSQWLAENGITHIHPMTIHNRLAKGWSWEDAVGRPVDKPRKGKPLIPTNGNPLLC